VVVDSLGIGPERNASRLEPDGARIVPGALVACRHALLPKSSPSASRESRCASRSGGPSNSLSRLSTSSHDSISFARKRSTAVALRRSTHLGRGLRIRVRRCVRSWPGNAKRCCSFPSWRPCHSCQLFRLATVQRQPLGADGARGLLNVAVRICGRRKACENPVKVSLCRLLAG
jgi:hypothetical protein